MKDYEFLDAVGGIESRFVEKATNRQTKHSPWKYVVSVAACFVLLVGIYYAYPKLAPPPTLTPDPSGTTERTDEPDTYPELAPGVSFNLPDNHEKLNGKQMISGYGESVINGDIAVNNGGTFFSDSLTSAMKEYNDTVNYRVLIELFQDGTQIWSGSEEANKEAQRLSEMGIIVGMEIFKDATGSTYYYFTLHATYEQLKDFPASDDFGYSIMLYDEYFGVSANGGTVAFNGFAQDSD